jgi:hypothetical protein
VGRDDVAGAKRLLESGDAEVNLIEGPESCSEGLVRSLSFI